MKGLLKQTWKKPTVHQCLNDWGNPVSLKVVLLFLREWSGQHGRAKSIPSPSSRWKCVRPHSDLLLRVKNRPGRETRDIFPTNMLHNHTHTPFMNTKRQGNNYWLNTRYRKYILLHIQFILLCGGHKLWSNCGCINYHSSNIHMVFPEDDGNIDYVEWGGVVFFCCCCFFVGGTCL